jgi:hypothetical protein
MTDVNWSTAIRRLVGGRYLLFLENFSQSGVYYPTHQPLVVDHQKLIYSQPPTSPPAPPAHPAHPALHLLNRHRGVSDDREFPA